MFKSNWTKWIPLGGYAISGTDHVVMASRNIKTGMLRFKTKQVTGNFPWSISHSVGVREQIDVAAQWKKLTDFKTT